MRGTFRSRLAGVLLIGFLAAIAGAADAQPAPALDVLTQPQEAAEAPEAGEPEADRERPADLAAYEDIPRAYVSGSALDLTHQGLDRFRARLIAALSSAPDLLPDIRDTLARASPSGEPSFFVGLAAFLVFLISVGRAVALLFAIYVARPIFVGMQRQAPQGLAEKAPVLAARVGLVIAGAAITLLVAVLVGAGYYPDDLPAAVRAAILAFTGYAALRVIDTIWRMILAPYLPDYRVPALSDREALRLYRWMYASFLTIVLLTWSLYWLKSLGLRLESYALLAVVATIAQAAVVAAGAFATRDAVTKAFLGGREPQAASWLARGAARLWLPGLIVYLVLASGEAAYRAIMGAPLGLSPPMIVVIVTTAAILLYGLTICLIERLSRRRTGRAAPLADSPPTVATPYRDVRADGGLMDSDDEEGGGPAPAAPRAASAGGASTLQTFEDLARRVASLFAIAAGAWALVYFWFGEVAFRDGSMLDLALGVIQIVFVGYVIYHAVRIWIDQRIAEEGGVELDLEPGDEGGGVSAASRLATLLPLVRSFVLALIVLSVAIFVAMELGLNVAPLLGGAGIVGIAIGFGSQTLVRDILSGAFFLMDDAFRKGEYVDIGDVKGTVEKISLRSFQLRHHLGALNTIPFGEVKYLTNYSRDWVMMKLPLRLTYDTDVDKVRKLIKKLGQELLQHPEEGHKFLQPLKSQGVYQMEDSAMIVRVKFMTRPGDQWTTRKLVYQRIRELFEREGIKFAHREVTVRIPGLSDDRPLTEEERRAAGAAARRAVDEVDEEARLRPVAVGDDR